MLLHKFSHKVLSHYALSNPETSAQGYSVGGAVITNSVVKSPINRNPLKSFTAQYSKQMLAKELTFVHSDYWLAAETFFYLYKQIGSLQHSTQLFLERSITLPVSTCSSPNLCENVLLPSNSKQPQSTLTKINAANAVNLQCILFRWFLNKSKPVFDFFIVLLKLLQLLPH